MRVRKIAAERAVWKELTERNQTLSFAGCVGMMSYVNWGNLMRRLLFALPAVLLATPARADWWVAESDHFTVYAEGKA